MNGIILRSPTEGFDFWIPNYGLDHQTGAIVDIEVDFDFIEDVGAIDPYAYPEFVSIVNYIKNYLVTYPNEVDFWEILNRNLVNTLLSATIPTTFGVEYNLDEVLDSLSVAIEVSPGSSLVNFPRKSLVIGSPGPAGSIDFQEAFSFEIPHYGLDHQGGAIVDIFIDFDFKKDVGVADPFAYPEFVSVVNFIKAYLLAYPNETDFWEILNRNLVTTLLTDTIPTDFGASYELDQLLDSLSVRIEVESGSSLVNYDRASSVTGSPNGAGIDFDEAFSFEISDYGLDHQGGAIVDIGIELDFIKDVAISDPFAYPEFVSVVNFIKDYLINYPNETDFWEILNKNLVTTLLTEVIPTTFGAEYQLDKLVDSLTVDIQVEGGSSLVNFNRASEVKGSPKAGDIDLDESFSFEIANYGLDHQGGAIVDIKVDMDFKDGVGDSNPYAYPEFVSIVNFIKDYLVNYPNETDFWEILNKNLTAALLTEIIPTTFGVEYRLAEVVETLNVDIQVHPGSSLVNFPRVSTVSRGTEVGPSLNKLNAGTFAITTPGGADSELKIKVVESKVGIVRDLCVFTVDDESGRIDGIAPGQTGYARAAVNRATSAMSVLASLPSGFNPAELTRSMSFEDGDLVRFMLIKKNSLDDVVSGKAGVGSVLFGNQTNLAVKETASGYTLTWNVLGGNRVNAKDLVFEIETVKPEPLLGTKLENRPENELFDLRPLAAATEVTATFDVRRESPVETLVGFYKVNDVDGTVMDTVTSLPIRPGEPKYIEMAMRNRAPDLALSVADQTTASFDRILEGGSLWAPFVVVKGTPEQLLDSNKANDPAVYFPFSKANADRLDHIRLGANNTFFFEDRRNGGNFDFNDMIVTTNLSLAG